MKDKTFLIVGVTVVMVIASVVALTLAPPQLEPTLAEEEPTSELHIGRIGVIGPGESVTVTIPFDTTRTAELTPPPPPVVVDKIEGHDVLQKPDSEGYWWWYADAGHSRGFDIVQVNKNTKGLEVFDCDYDLLGKGRLFTDDWLPIDKWVEQRRTNGGHQGVIRFIKVPDNPFESAVHNAQREQ